MGGLIGPTLVGHLEDTTGSITGALIPLGIVLIVGAVLPLLARKPEAAPP